MTIQEIQDQIIEEFSFFESWEERYQYLIDLGKELDQNNEMEKTDAKLIVGCQSRVWLEAKIEGENLVFTADSDAILPKGIAALLVRIYNNQPPKEILLSNTDFIEKIKLQEFLSPTRANGLLAMIKQFKFYAIAFESKKNNA
ncbi:MAG: Fe-S metabolism protein SufE [Flavobacteriaceae bacterium]|nr:MAG: Fe-S metabolism protein SufE [Flavobacteriaceae bacterium]